jgi:hypothetical protein
MNNFHPSSDDLPCDHSDPLTAHFFRVVAIRECLKYSSSQEFEKSLSRRRLVNNYIWVLFPLLMLSHGLVWLCTYLSTGGINATISLKLFNSNREQLELCQKYSMPTCALKTPVMDKADRVDKFVQKNPEKK